MAETLISPGVLARENDQSFIQQNPVEFGAAIIGPAVKGPVEIPTLVTSFSEYQAIFGTTDNQEAALERFCENFELLNDSTKKRLVVENDDSPNEYSVKDLIKGVYLRIGIPITFDYFHHKFNTGGLTEEEALIAAYATWPKGVTQCCHYSESRRKEKLDESIRPQAHSDIIYEKINTYGLEPDIVIEAKLKEQAIFKRVI